MKDAKVGLIIKESNCLTKEIQIKNHSGLFRVNMNGAHVLLAFYKELIL